MFSPFSFSPLSFSIHAFNAYRGATARSGYWRLFYYNMQAESEAKRHNVTEAVKPPAQAKAKAATRKVVRSLPAAPTKVNIEPTPVMPVALMPFVPKPIYQPVVLLEYAPIGYDQTWEQLAAVMRTHVAVPRAVQQCIEAVNDDEEECVEVLLLLAA